MAKTVIQNTDSPKDSRVPINNNFTELYEMTNVHDATSKATPVDADELGLWDSVATTIKKLTWANLKATLKIYFDTLYPAKTGWQAVSDSWSYASADAPTFTITVPSGAASLYSPGMRIKLTQTTVKYFIVTAVADTVLTVYGGTDYTLVNAAISAISYSTQKAPLGFPLNPIKWTVEVIDANNRTESSPTATTWYNTGSINISVPIGSWKIAFMANTNAYRSSGSPAEMFASLSTANNSATDSQLVCWVYVSAGQQLATIFREKVLTVATKTVYYLNIKTDSVGMTSIALQGGTYPTIIRAVCAYL